MHLFSDERALNKISAYDSVGIIRISGCLSGCYEHRWRKVLQVGGAQCSTNIIIICIYLHGV